MADWQPIETAPKDGRPLWLVESGELLGLTIPHQFVGFWLPHKFYRDGGCWQSIDRDAVGKPTHWQPLPDPPKESR